MNKLQKNKLLATIDSLVDLNQINAIVAIQADLKKQYEDLEGQLNDLLSQYEYVSKIIEAKKESVVHVVNTIPSSIHRTRKYDTALKLPVKFKYFLFKANRFLKFREVAEMIVNKDGAGDTDKIARQLTSSTKELKNSKFIVGVTPNGKTIDTFWGLPEWLDENGIIKQEFMFDHNSVKVKDALESPYKEI